MRQPLIARLVADLDSRELPVRWYAAYTLGRRGAEAKDAVGPLCKQLSHVEDPDPIVRNAAAEAIGRIREE